MEARSHYWRWVRLDAAGQRRVEELATTKTWLLLQFPNLLSPAPISTGDLQRQLWQWARSDSDNLTHQEGAERCLRCLISNQIDRVCQQLAAQFWERHGFSRDDLLPLVLGDEVLASSSLHVAAAYQSLATDILHSFDPDKAGLGTWVTRRVRHHHDLNAVLLERGVYLVSDWAILNDTSPPQLQRVLAEFHGLTAAEIEPASLLLQVYHQVYRQERLAAAAKR